MVGGTLLCPWRLIAHINVSQRRRKHPSPRDVPHCWSYNFAHSGLPRRTRGRRSRACTPGRFMCEFPPRILVPPAFLSLSKISWESCEIFGSNSTDPNLQCGYLEVPMDYHDSSAGYARLAVARYVATGSKKLGSVFYNPGDQIYSPFVTFPLIPNLRRRTWPFRSRDCSGTRPAV